MEHSIPFPSQVPDLSLNYFVPTSLTGLDNAGSTLPRCDKLMLIFHRFDVSPRASIFRPALSTGSTRIFEFTDDSIDDEMEKMNFPDDSRTWNRNKEYDSKEQWWQVGGMTS